jgi:hypothetical protein
MLLRIRELFHFFESSYCGGDSGHASGVREKLSSGNHGGARNFAGYHLGNGDSVKLRN